YAELHQVNAAICTMREHNGLAPISDAPPDNGRTCLASSKNFLLPANAGATSEPMPISKTSHSNPRGIKWTRLSRLTTTMTALAVRSLTAASFEVRFCAGAIPAVGLI